MRKESRLPDDWFEKARKDLPRSGYSCLVVSVVTLLSVVDLPESSKDASAGVNGAFQASFWPVHCA